MSDPIINKVAEAGIEQIDLGDFIFRGDLIEIDLQDQLWEGLVLKEKDFRAWVKDHDWSQYEGKIVCLYCSTEAIIPAWAFMLVSSKLDGSNEVLCASPEEAREILFFQNLNNWDITHLNDKRTMVKGCSNIPNPNRAYVVLTQRLQPIVKSLMFGEPCSAVPVYKRKD